MASIFDVLPALTDFQHRSRHPVFSKRKVPPSNGGTFFVSNVDYHLLSVDDLGDLYCFRWGLEVGDEFHERRFSNELSV